MANTELVMLIDSEKSSPLSMNWLLRCTKPESMFVLCFDFKLLSALKNIENSVLHFTTTYAGFTSDNFWDCFAYFLLKVFPLTNVK